MEIILTVVVLWLVCGVVAYGLTLGYFQTEYPELRDMSDVWFALFMSVFGPVGVLAIMTQCVLGNYRFYGLQFLPKQPESRFNGDR